MSRKGKNLQLLSAVELVRCVPTRGLVTQWEGCDVTMTVALRGEDNEKEREGV